MDISKKLLMGIATELNPTDINLSDGVSGSARYQIYGGDSGIFVTPQFFGVTVKFTDGTETTAGVCAPNRAQRPPLHRPPPPLRLPPPPLPLTRLWFP